jgi:hypothetical protein
MVLLALVTVAYVAAVVWLRRARRRAMALTDLLPELPHEDRPPQTATGWPPEGDAELEAYVAEGLAALDAYLSEGFAT